MQIQWVCHYVSLALFPRLHIRCMKKAPKTALCANNTKKEPETFRFPAFSGTDVHNDTLANPHEIKVFGSRRIYFTEKI